MNHYTHASLDRSISSQSGVSTVLPLTKENLSRITTDMEPSVDMLARYYDSLMQCHTPSDRRERYAPSSPTVDTVMAPPRLLSFPYHNDSHFLPTAERPTSPSLASGTPTCSMTNLSLRSSQRTWVNPDSLDCSQRRGTLTSVSRYSLGAIFSRQSERTLPLQESCATLDHVNASDASDISSVTLTSPEPSKPKKKKSIRWFSEFAKLFKKQKCASNPVATVSTCRASNSSRVWYSQYTANPQPPPGLAMAVAA